MPDAGRLLRGRRHVVAAPAAVPTAAPRGEWEDAAGVPGGFRLATGGTTTRPAHDAPGGGALLEEPSLLPVDDVVRRLATDPDRGLSASEAARRLAEHGPNELVATAPVPTWRRLLEQLRDPLVYLLLAAVAVSLVAWQVEGRSGAPVDALVITAVVVLNAVLGYVQEARAENAVAALQRLGAATATVVRDGARHRVPTSELVPGDVLLLAEGDTVSADARLLAAATLMVSEAALTGESDPVLKDPSTLPAPAALADRLDMVHDGTAVVRGTGRAVVTATGMDTEVGRVADLLHATPEAPTPLQQEMARVGRALGTAVVLIALVVVATVLVVLGVDSTEEVVSTLLLGVSLAVAAVPEGLPAILSVVLALGVQRMAAHDAIVTRLSSVETLGCATVICSDKTGTLTTGQMTIGRVVTTAGEVTVTGAGYRPEGHLEHDGTPIAPDSELWRQAAVVVSGGSLANDAAIRQEPGGEWVVQGDPTEAAFLVADVKLGTGELRAGRFTRVGHIPFTSERRLMTSLEADGDEAGCLSLFTKGAPDVLLERCTHVRRGDQPEPLDAAGRARVLADVERLSDQAFRTLGVAYRSLGVRDAPADLADLEHELVYAGTVGILDPPREEAAAAIEEAHRAGVRVVMITGDHPRTAARIAHDLGIADDLAAVSGTELDAMDDATFRETVRRRSVYARVTPAHKLRIVDALQADGQVVAMTGDGVNDAPALRSADIGVAMGRAGTEVTKEAATMILADDDFATIVRAVREGRGIFLDIRKFLRYLLSSNIAEVLTVFLGVVLGGVLGLTDGTDAIVLPLLATQILWINLLTDSGPALAMGVDPQSDDVMGRPPRGRAERVIDPAMWRGVLILGLVMAASTLGTVDLLLPGGPVEGGAMLDTARTAGFTVLVLAQLFNALGSRSETATAFRGLFANRWLWGAIALSAALQVAVVHVPLLNEAFTTTPLSVGEWALCVGMASAVLWAGELRKLVLRVRGRGR